MKDLTLTKQVRLLNNWNQNLLYFLILEPGVHHIPLDVYGFPDIPNYPMDEKDSFFNSNNGRRKVKKSTKRKPLYKPPPVLTEYNPPSSSSRLSQEYRHSVSDSSSSNSNINKKMVKLLTLENSTINNSFTEGWK